MLELWAIVQCFIDTRGKLETYCRPLANTYYSEDNCDRARINLYRDGQCGPCKFDPFTYDLVGPMGKDTNVSYSCWKQTTKGLEPLGRKP